MQSTIANDSILINTIDKDESRNDRSLFSKYKGDLQEKIKKFTKNVSLEFNYRLKLTLMALLKSSLIVLEFAAGSRVLIG